MDVRGRQSQPSHLKGNLSRGLLPDAKFIRREIPIHEVVAKLGLKGNGRYFYCWREAHPKRDGRATVGVHVVSNSVRCFKCHARNLSPIDLVVDVLGVSVGEAFRWFEREYAEIPRVKLRMTTNQRGITKEVCKGYTARRWPEVSCDALALSPAWTRLSHAEKAIAAALIARTPRERDVQPLVTTSYRELQAWSGVGNRQTVARALARFRSLGLIQTALVPTGKETLHGFATRQTLVRLTWHSQRFQSWLTATEGPHPVHHQPQSPTATGYTVPKVNQRGAPQNSGVALESWKPAEGGRVQ